MLRFVLLIFSFNLLVSGLQHEKSFMFDTAASDVVDIALYNRSLLITSANDMVQKDIETGNLQRRFIAHTGQIHSFKVFNGSRMITSGWDDMIIVWDLLSGSILRRIWLGASNTYPKSTQLAGDSLFVGGMDSKVRIVNMINGRVVQTFNIKAEANVIVVKDDNFYVGKIGSKTQLEKYSAATRTLKVIYVGHRSSVLTLSIWDKMLFSGSADYTIICWNEENGQIIRIYDGLRSPVDVLSIFDNYLFSTGRDSTILKWNVESGIIEKTFSDENYNGINSFAIEQDSLYSGSMDGTVVKWDLNTTIKTFTYYGRNNKLWCLVLWKNFVIAGGDSNALKIQDRSQNSYFPVEIVSGPNEQIFCMILQNDTLFTGGLDSNIKRHNLIDYTIIKLYYGHTSSITALSLDEKFLYSGSYDFSVKRWNISSGSVDKEYIGHVELVWTISNRDSYLYSGSTDRSVIIWDKEKTIQVDLYKYPSQVVTIVINDENLIVGAYDMYIVSLATGLVLASHKESSVCYALATNRIRIYTGHDDGLIRGRNTMDLNVLEFFQGHRDMVTSLVLDDVGILFSTGFDGSVKKWNMASRGVSFSYENRNGSVTALGAMDGMLFVGTKGGLINSFDIGNAYIIESVASHKSFVTSLNYLDGIMYSSGLDGMVFEFNPSDAKSSIEVLDAGILPITSMALNMFNLIAIRGENEVVMLPRVNSTGSIKRVVSLSPIVSIAATDDIIFGGSRAGSIVAWSATSLQIIFSLEDHTSQVNSLLVQGSSLYSASNDKIIIKWSIEKRRADMMFTRLSATALGHLGPVNSISVCRGTLFSAGSDLTTRRWNTITGRHEDVYFGPIKSVTSVVCYNGSVFAGSEDFSVLMYSPTLADTDDSQTTSRTPTDSRRGAKTKIAFKSSASNSEITQTSVLIGGILAAVILAAALFIAYFFYSSKVRGKQVSKHVANTLEFSYHMTDLQTVVNSVIGISKHAAYLVANSSVACIKKLATGGGGEVYLARVMKAFLTEKTGNLVIQKVVFVKNQTAQEAFYQEVGIMIMLSPFPNFGRIIGYTENPVSMILQYYPDGSLHDYIKDKIYGKVVIVKILKEVSSSLRIMHAYHLAHCDIKPQNVLIGIVEGIPTCYLTDFGITQVLSEKILASRAFNVINLRGLSVFYAAPEAFTCFRTKVYNEVDFKNYDVYSLACIVLELLTRKAPWS